MDLETFAIKGAAMAAIKATGTLILGIAVVAGLFFLGVFLIDGTVAIAERLLPALSQLSVAALMFCVVMLGPMSFFRVSRRISMVGFFVASYLFGLSVWLYGLLTTYYFWGSTGTIIGLFLGIVGVVPLGMIASLLHAAWFGVGELAFGLAITYGTRTLAFFLAGKIDSANARSILAEVPNPDAPKNRQS